MRFETTKPPPAKTGGGLVINTIIFGQYNKHTDTNFAKGAVNYEKFV